MAQRSSPPPLLQMQHKLSSKIRLCAANNEPPKVFLPSLSPLRGWYPGKLLQGCTDRPRWMADSYPAPKPKKVASNATRLPRAATPRTRQVPDIKNAGEAKRKILSGSKEPACPMQRADVTVGSAVF